MKEQLRVEHPEVSLTQLEKIISEQHMPVRRSPHIGNQNAAELCLQAHMPPGIDVLVVDTITGNDNYSSPRTLMLQNGVSIPLAAVKASKRVVSHVLVRDDIADHASEEVIAIFNLQPGRPIADIHQESLKRLQIPNMPVPMMEFFMTKPDVLHAVMAAVCETSTIRRQVTGDGKIIPVDSQAIDSVYGVEDISPKDQGAMIPLNGMMAADVVMQITDGAQTSLHLGGPDMIQYTRDKERMAEVANLVGRALSLLGMQTDTHCLKIADMTSYGDHLDPKSHVSQHAMLIPAEIGILKTTNKSQMKVMV